MKVLGIDPGLSGAVVLFEEGQPLKARRDFKALKDIAHAVNELGAEADVAAIEQVGAMPGQGVCSMFSFGRSTGAAWGAMYCAGNIVHIYEIHPLKWQNFYRKACDIPRPQPFDSRVVACRLLPQEFSWFKRQKDHGTADAALLAYYVAKTEQ